MTINIEEEEREAMDYRFELLRMKLAEEFGEFAKGIGIEWERDSEYDSLHIKATFTIGAQGMVSNNMIHTELDVLKLTVINLVHNIERTLYDMLPVYGTEPQIAGVKIRIDSHLPKGVIWMHPEVYAGIMQNPELRNLLIPEVHRIAEED